MKHLFVIFSMIMMGSASAQDYIGQYSLEGVREMASELRLNPDSTFNFYFVYGAAERYANGYWVDEKARLVLNSPEKLQKDFNLITSKKNSGKFTVQVSDANKQVLPFVSVYIKSGDEILSERADQEGKVTFEINKADTIFLQHEIWTNEAVEFPVTDGHNYFEFSIHPDIANVVFKDIILYPDGKNLRGMHPLLKGEYSFIRNDP